MVFAVLICRSYAFLGVPFFLLSMSRTGSRVGMVLGVLRALLLLCLYFFKRQNGLLFLLLFCYCGFHRAFLSFIRFFGGSFLSLARA